MQRSTEIRAVVEEHGIGGYLDIQKRLLEGETLPNGAKIAPRSPYDFSIRALWEGMVGPVEETLNVHRPGYIDEYARVQEAVGTGNFASATGQLINAMVIQGYNAVPQIGNQLVTVMPSNLRDERIVGFTHQQGPLEVVENEPYSGSSFEDKYVTTTQAKMGRLLDVTEEAVTFDQTGQVLLRAQRLGEVTAQERERTIVRGVANVDSGAQVYRPSGTAEALYSSGNSNLLSTATPLVDWTDIQEARVYHATTQTDDRAADAAGSGRPVMWNPRILLVAEENAGTAARIVGATQVGTAPGHTSAANTVSNNPFSGMTALSSPYLDEAEGEDQWADASDWFIGDFPRQFVWKEIWPLQTFRAPSTDSSAFDRDVVARFKVRYYGGINAIDERYVVQVNAV